LAPSKSNPDFLKHKFGTTVEYKAKNFSSRATGVPQGCSLSLFLSNVAGHELDQDLGRKNGRFVRFADDVVCVTYGHDDAVSVVDPRIPNFVLAWRASRKSFKKYGISQAGNPSYYSGFEGLFGYSGTN
jgi:hypothetical protein